MQAVDISLSVVIVLVLVGAFALLITRLPLLRSQNSLESYVSREAVFLYNNLLFAGFALVVLVATVYPLLVEALVTRWIGSVFIEFFKANPVR